MSDSTFSYSYWTPESQSKSVLPPDAQGTMQPVTARGSGTVSEPPRYEQKLQFVSGHDKASRKLARSHIVRERLRKLKIKEEEQRSQPGSQLVYLANPSTDGEARYRSGTAYSESDVGQRMGALARPSAHTPSCSGSSVNGKFGTSTPKKHPDDDEDQRRLEPRQHLTFATLLGSGSQDPFAAFPVAQCSQPEYLNGTCKQLLYLSSVLSLM